ncbi:iron-siderophore ABC transporter substrate-binding protein [Pseudonocardia petroleophila]|uniref:ABC transporter substrate-binding protein n=1 Tax=Pseudonocardia petroleophila TaxID=37331 RepID=A0A7G7MMU5_9PSEU|nr:ABC transporter substrate-binding protein [Pseudonocardia petroleophila]QNG54106.1 ABC transporter substrate-binding protein [Pseudonocardia petroleophila]
MKRIVVGAAALLVALAGCATPGGERAAVADSSPQGTFPVTVEHALGSTTIEREPTRVVTLGPSDADAVLALGVVPVGINSRYGFERGVGPWAEAALGDADPVVTAGNELQFEAIAALRPDVIVNVGSGGDPAEHDTLSRIAPTIALPAGAAPYAPRWQDATRLIAQALGRAAEGERLVAATEDHLREVAAENPSFAGRTLTYLDVLAGEAYVGGREATVVTTMRELGFVDTPYVAGLPAEETQSALSAELLPQVDADVVLIYAIDGSPEQALAANAGLANLGAVRAGRAQFLPDLSLSAPSVLSIPYGVDRLVPFLQAATG